MIQVQDEPVSGLEASVVDERLAEHRFLLMAQTEIQKLLNEKNLRYADLSRRMGVSEARVSQMFGDEATNLTIRTIARIFHKLDERPVLLSERELARRVAASGAIVEAPTWIVSGLIADYLQKDACTEPAADGPASKAPDRTAPRSRAWATAERHAA